MPTSQSSAAGSKGSKGKQTPLAKAAAAKVTATRPASTKAAVTKAATRRQTTQILQKKSPVGTSSRATKTRPVFPAISADVQPPPSASIENEMHLLASIAESVPAQAAPVDASQTQRQQQPAIRPQRLTHSRNLVVVGRSNPAPVAQSPNPDLERENEELKRRLEELQGMIATQRPLAEIERPELTKASTKRIAPFDQIVGLAQIPQGDANLNALRKRMLSWIWDIIHDAIFVSKQQAKFARYATYDVLSKRQADALVAEIMDKVRSAGILRRPFFKDGGADIPRFDSHWPIREILKTVLYNQKKASLRITNGANDMRELYNKLSPEMQKRLCDPPVPLIDKAPRIPGAGRGRPSNASRLSADPAHSPWSLPPSSPSSLDMSTGIASRIGEYILSPSPLRAVQQIASSQDVGDYTLAQLSIMSPSEINIFGGGEASESIDTSPQEGVVGEEEVWSDGHVEEEAGDVMGEGAGDAVEDEGDLDGPEDEEEVAGMVAE